MLTKNQSSSLGPQASPALPASKVTPKPSSGKKKGNGRAKKCTLLDTSRIVASKGTAANQLGTTPLQQFEISSGKPQQGNKEVHAQFEHFFDGAVTALTPWEVVLVSPETLPGVTSTSSHRIKRSRFYVLPPGFSDNNATNNVMVLSGVLSEQSDLTKTLAASTTTFLRQSVTPTWIEVLDCDFEKLVRNNLSPADYNKAIELGRFSLVNPDTGAAQPQTTLQFKCLIDYAYSLELLSTADMGHLLTAQPITMPTLALSFLPVFPRAISLNNSI